MAVVFCLAFAGGGLVNASASTGSPNHASEIDQNVSLEDVAVNMFEASLRNLHKIDLRLDQWKNYPFDSSRKDEIIRGLNGFHSRVQNSIYLLESAFNDTKIYLQLIKLSNSNIDMRDTMKARILRDYDQVLVFLTGLLNYQIPGMDRDGLTLSIENTLVNSLYANFESGKRIITELRQ